MVKNLPANAEDMSSAPGTGRSPEEGSDTPLQYFLPGKSREKRTLASYSPWSHKKAEHHLITKQQQQSIPAEQLR